MRNHYWQIIYPSHAWILSTLYIDKPQGTSPQLGQQGRSRCNVRCKLATLAMRKRQWLKRLSYLETSVQQTQQESTGSRLILDHLKNLIWGSHCVCLRYSLKLVWGCFKDRKFPVNGGTMTMRQLQMRNIMALVINSVVQELTCCRSQRTAQLACVLSP